MKSVRTNERTKEKMVEQGPHRRTRTSSRVSFYNATRYGEHSDGSAHALAGPASALDHFWRHPFLLRLLIIRHRFTSPDNPTKPWYSICRLTTAHAAEGRSKPELENREPRTQDLTRFWNCVLFQAEPRKMMWRCDELVTFVPSSRKIVQQCAFP